MKWFKHLTGALNDNLIFEAIERFGGDGYLVFFGTLETVADEFDIFNPGSCRVSIKKLTKNFQISRQKLVKILSFFDQKAKEKPTESKSFFVCFEKDHVVIKCNRLAELCDEHTQKMLKKNRESVGSESGLTPAIEEEVEKEVEKEKRVSNDTLPAPPVKSNGIPSQEIITLYHEILPGLPRVKVWNESRKRKLKARWTEDKARQNIDWWREYFETVRGSPFLMGNRNDFKADFEWLIEAGNLPKVAEGRYKNGSQQGAMRI